MAASDHTEVEWQFDAPGGLDRVIGWLQNARVPGYEIVPLGAKHLKDRYYDTADWRLHHAGYTARVRQKGDGAELTLKSMAEAVRGVRSRRELNEPLADGAASPGTGDGPCSRAIAVVAGRRPLRALFDVHTERRLFELRDGAGRVAEIAVDLSSFRGAEGEGEGQLQRVEIEVEGDAVARAQRFVDLFVVAAGLEPGRLSKFEAGLAAAGLSVAPASPALGPTTVHAGQTAAEAAYAILRRQFGIFLANEAGTRLGEDIEALHDMRVAARRMRAAMSAFADVMPPALARHREQLGWVARALGEVRDLDVQLERMTEWRAAFDADHVHALDAIETLLLERRVGARRRMLAALDSRRYELFLERFARFLRQGPPGGYAPGRAPILAVAPALLKRRYRAVRKRGDAITPASPPEQYHELRIYAKKLRYAFEFVGPIYGAPAVAFSQKVAVLQEILGLHQDAEVAITMLREMAHTQARRLGPATILAMGALSERYRADAARLRAQFPPAYKEIRGESWRRLIRDVERRAPATGS